MLDELVGLLGGRVAEQLIIGDISTGASNDIERATEQARNMVTKYGMSEKLGPITFGSGHDEVFLGKQYGNIQNYSDKTAHDIDEEINKIIVEQYERTEEIIREHLDKLHIVAKELMLREKLEKEEFAALMKGEELPPIFPEKKDEEKAEIIEKDEPVSDTSDIIAENEDKTE